MQEYRNSKTRDQFEGSPDLSFIGIGSVVDSHGNRISGRTITCASGRKVTLSVGEANALYGIINNLRNIDKFSQELSLDDTSSPSTSPIAAKCKAYPRSGR
jgi:hypothetical protein